MMKKLCLLLAAVFAAGMMMACNAQVLSADTTPAAAETNATPSAMPFADVPSDAYYADAVQYCWETGLMAGTSASTFSPDGTTTRAQVVTILWRLADEPAGGVSGFADVPAAAYYAEAAAWAEQTGIITGHDDGRFAPEDAISRAQLAVILWRYAGEPAPSGAADFADAAQIPDYARAAAAWAQEEGIISGRAGNIFDPEGTATRGEAAVMIYRYRFGAEPSASQPASGRTLVAYFSCTGTTAQIAAWIADATGADSYEIVPEVPYTEEDLAYYTGGRADREQEDASARPAISGSVENMAQYDVIFLGYPIWHGQAPRIISTFLESYDFSGTTIIPFCTSHSSGIGSSAENLHGLCADTVTWLDGRRFSGDASESDVSEWVDGLGLTERGARTVGEFDFETKSVLLNSGYEMPIMGLGTYSLSDEECAVSIAALLEAGGRLIDTAYMYGNEAAVGQAVRNSDVPREEIFVITKLYPNQYSYAADAIDAALEKMGLDYIDMILLHHPGDGDVEAYLALEQAVADGKVHSIGLSNWYVEELEEFLPEVNITPALVQNEIHPYYQENDVIPYIQSLGIVVQGWYPLGGRGHTAELLGDETISAIAAAHSVSSAQVILRWNLQKGVVVIPGSSDPEHIRENLDLFGFELTDAEMAQINALNRNEKHDWY
ncbi:MAG: aldo/keto reductase [Oscillospiraceae bacterium]|nr:aldo/keto reductase [Oscillospiraceae bacterium]